LKQFFEASLFGVGALRVPRSSEDKMFQSVFFPQIFGNSVNQRSDYEETGIVFVVCDSPGGEKCQGIASETN